MTISKKDTKSFLLGTAAGSVLGAVTALLLAPKAGKELRKDIATGAQQAGETTARIAGQVTETTGRIAKEIGSRTAELAVKSKEAAVSVKDVFAGKREESELMVAAISGTADAAGTIETSFEDELSENGGATS